MDEECGDEQAPLEFLVSLRAKRLDGDVGYVWIAEHSLGRMSYPYLGAPLHIACIRNRVQSRGQGLGQGAACHRAKLKLRSLSRAAPDRWSVIG